MNVFGSGAPSSAGRASGGRSVGVGLPSTCSSLGVFRFDGECLLLVQVDLSENTFKIQEDRNTTVLKGDILIERCKVMACSND